MKLLVILCLALVSFVVGVSFQLFCKLHRFNVCKYFQADEAVKKEIAETVTKCREQFNLTPDHWQRIKSQDSTLEITEDVQVCYQQDIGSKVKLFFVFNFQCFSKCLADTFGYFKEDKLNEERILRITDEFGRSQEHIRDNLKTCAALYTGNSQLTCALSHEIAHCIHKL